MLTVSFQYLSREAENERLKRQVKRQAETMKVARLIELPASGSSWVEVTSFQSFVAYV